MLLARPPRRRSLPCSAAAPCLSSFSTDEATTHATGAPPLPSPPGEHTERVRSLVQSLRRRPSVRPSGSPSQSVRPSVLPSPSSTGETGERKRPVQAPKKEGPPQPGRSLRARARAEREDESWPYPLIETRGAIRFLCGCRE